MVITTVASPYGIGGFVSVNGVVTEYFADHISPTDCKILQREHGSHEEQQAFEALGLLVAFRLWKPLLLHSRACITFRADNVGALTVIAVVKGKGHSLETIARELALDLVACDYLPYTAAHLPVWLTERPIPCPASSTPRSSRGPRLPCWRMLQPSHTLSGLTRDGACPTRTGFLALRAHLFAGYARMVASLR